MTDAIAKEARLAILRALKDQVDGRLSDLLLQRTLDVYGFRRDRDWIVTQLNKLASLGAVSLSEAGTVTIARLERPGRDHLEERSVLQGVTRPHEVE
ncbi:MAG: hypothetical protein AAF707_00170 [Pseudomonadota bacterium]